MSATSPTEFFAGAFVAGGKFQVRNAKALEAFIAAQKDGPYHVSIRRARAVRSEAQNAYYHGCIIPTIQTKLEPLGYDERAVHELMKSLFLPRKLAVCDGNGEIVGEFVMGGSTSRLSKEDFYDYTEKVIRWAAETLSLVIEPPDPDWKRKRTAVSA